MVRVVIYQHRMLHYRVQLFELLRVKLLAEGVELVVVHGDATAAEVSRKDGGELPWAKKVLNKSVRFKEKDLLWQGFPAPIRGAALVVLMQENRMLTNYPWQLIGPLVGTRLAFWGHGKNHQALSPDGWRERWKAWWLRRVDWWFAYTEASAQHVIRMGFNSRRVTVLDNAINVSQFTKDLASVSESQLAQERTRLGMTTQSAVAIYCGSIYPGKRIEVLLAAADLLRQRLHDFHLIVVGDGPLAAQVQTAAEARPWLHLRGVRKGPEKALDYRLAKVMLNPGMVGLHVVDAFAAQTPLVTQRSALHGPEFDYLVSGANGVVVESDSAQVYADAVARLFEQPAVLQAMQTGCAKDAKRYTVENMADNFVRGLLRCLEVEGFRPTPAVPQGVVDVGARDH